MERYSRRYNAARALLLRRFRRGSLEEESFYPALPEDAVQKRRRAKQ